MGCGLLGPAVPRESSHSPLAVFSGVAVTPTAAHVCMLSHSAMSDSSETPRIVARQAPPSMEFPSNPHCSACVHAQSFSHV